SSGTATFSTSSLNVAAHSIHATYGGNSNFNTSTSSNLTQTVNKASTTTSVASSVNPSLVGQTVTFTATVSITSPGSGTATGTVSFYDGATLLGTGTLNSSDIATFSTSTLSLGTHPSISATYGGDSHFNGSNSSAISQTVNKASSTTSLAESG